MDKGVEVVEPFFRTNVNCIIFCLTLGFCSTYLLLVNWFIWSLETWFKKKRFGIGSSCLWVGA